MQRTDTSDGSSIRMIYNDISLPIGLYYTVAGAGSRNVYYTYAERDNLPKKTSFGSGSDYSAENTYDGLGRLNYVKYETPSDSVNAIKADYNYYDWTSDPDRTTDLVNSIKYTYTSGQLGALERFYVYGAAGNITEEYTGSDTTGELKEKYGYDDKGQLVRHYSARQNSTFVYEYDHAGNITAKKTYPYVTTLSELNAIIDNPQDTVLYEYSQGVWGDLLEKYDGKSITSDNIGNITSWDGKTFTWNGRQLASYAKNGTTTSYKYNADGIRTQKQSGNVTTDYFLNGSQILMQQTKNGNTVTDTLWFFYDNQGNRIGLCRDGDYFYYLYNVQGDVPALVDAETGKIAANYQYGAWGEKTSVKTAEGYGDLGTANPFRYRGYYWDEESGLYYLNSRYYSPELCRFISADGQINGDILGTNLFAYCSNNPVNRTDEDGKSWSDIKSWFSDTWNYIKDKTVSFVEKVEKRFLDKHYDERMERNNPHPDYNEVSNNPTWTRVSTEQSKFHDNGMGKPEQKYTNEDGREAVFDGDTLVPITDPRYVGTFNYCPIQQLPSNPSLKDYWNFGITWIGHAIEDVIPYYIWGNSEADTTTFKERVMMGIG